MAVVISSFEKFRLLLWKNWLLQWSSKLSLILETVLPIMFILILIGVRAFFDSTNVAKKEFEQIQISNLNFFSDSWTPYSSLKRKIYYSPKNEILNKIISLAAGNLQLKFEAFNNASDMEAALYRDKVLAGIQFDESMLNIKQYPEKLHFIIRQNAAHSNWFAKRLFRKNNLKSGPINPLSKDDDNNAGSYGYIRTGFISIQHAISMAFLKLAGEVEILPEVFIKRFPHRAYVDDKIMVYLPYVISIIVILAYVYPASVLVKNITTEKEKQLKEIMKMMGLPNWIHWLAWFVRAFIPWSISAVLISGIFKIPIAHGRSILTNSDWSVVVCFLLLYVVVCICYCFMLATFFKKSSTASTVSSFIWFLLFIPFLLHNINDSDWDVKWLCLLPNSALGVVFLKIGEFEATGDGLQWNNLFEPITIDDASLGVCLGVMLLSALIFCIICLYVEQVFPGEYGMPKKWYFLFTKNYWFGERYFLERDYNSHTKAKRNDSNVFEVEPLEKTVGLTLLNLQKKFSKHTAVKDLTLNMYQDEITVLLGHNGAGKTTTISMICGMLPSTSGTAIVNGFNVATNTDEARSSLGICTQRNVLFDEMSVANHIKFFSFLKGVRGRAAIEYEIQEYLKILGLEAKANEKSKNLASGMKRKLSLCCALCGDARVVLCDEPSAGMDPSSRRQLWDLLQKEKIRRTILLTTHFMDEADVLGDRIAIMCDGEIKCYGSAFFLKKKFGAGYKLTCAKEKNCKTDKVTQFLSGFLPGLEPWNDTDNELIYLLPEYFADKFEGILAALEQNSFQLNLNGFGIGISSIEEVFMKVGAECDKSDITNRFKCKTSLDQVHYIEEISKDFFMKNSKLLAGIKLYVNHFLAMFFKKSLCTWRSKRILGLQICVPVIILVLALSIMSEHLTFDDHKFLKPLTFSLAQYSGEITMLENMSTNDTFATNISTSYKSLIDSFGKHCSLQFTGNEDVTNYMLDSLKESSQFLLSSKYIAAASIKKNEIIAWFNIQAYHAAPLTVNLVDNALAKAILGPNTEISVTNSPFYQTDMFEDNKATFSLYEFIDLALCFVMCFVSSFFVILVIKERASRIKMLQYLSGVGILPYWITQMLWDLAIFTFITSILIAVIFCFQIEGLAKPSDLGQLFILMSSFGVSAIPFAYLSSYLANEPATGFARSFVLNLLSGLALFLVYKFFMTRQNLISHFFQIFPHFCLAFGFEYLYEIKYHICKQDIHDICSIYPRCCDSSIFWSPFIFLLTGFVYFAFIILSEYKIFEVPKKKLQNIFRKLPPRRSFIGIDMEKDVERERKEIGEMCKNELETRNLVLDDVTKCYGEFVAVDRVSLCVKSSECFGLLGVNGAGKTTIFKILTGQESATYGDIFIEGLSMAKNVKKINKEIGYCPQFDALLHDLTGRETLRIFCLLRGVPLRNINKMIAIVAKNFGFYKHLDKLIATYSSGNKRKLSTALAILGNPKVIYLDEPTTGMDPASRRQLWHMIRRIREAGKAIVLSTHSMDECEALCTRLAVMVNGELKCIGPPQYLKNQYSKGLILKLKIKRIRDPLMRLDLMECDFKRGDRLSMKVRRNNIVDTLKEFIFYRFHNSKLYEEFQDLLTFHIPLETTKWSEMFGVMEQYRQELSIEDYSISQTTLEEVFLDFAKEQRERE